MTPDIRPFLRDAIAANPQRWNENTYGSCGFILQETLRRAGPDWAHVGKTANMDGDSYQPPGFAPFDVQLTRPDGQMQTVRIAGVSHDAAWHVPSGRQVKVIVNSAANSDPRPEIHGPASIGGDVIPSEHYRWHNPPVAQIGAGPAPGPTPPAPGPTPDPTLPGREEMMRAGKWLDDYYKSQEGLQRADGLSIGGRPDWEGIGAWLFDVYFQSRIAGKTENQAREKVKSEIRHAGGPTGEWQQKHPGETP